MSYSYYVNTRERELLKIDIYLKEAFYSTLAQACLGFIVNEEGYWTGEAPMHTMLICRIYFHAI